MLGGNAPCASEGRLETTAETGAVNRGNNRHPEPLQPRKHFLTGVARLLRLFRGLEFQKLLDVGAGDEIVALARDQNRRRDRGVALDVIEDSAHLFGEAQAQRVDGSARHIERENRHASVARNHESRHAKSLSARPSRVPSHPRHRRS